MSEHQVMDLISAFDRYQALRGFTVKTRRRRAWSLGAFAAHLDPAGFADATGVLVEDFLARWDDPQTRHAVLSDVRALYRWATRRGLLVADPTIAVDGVKVPRRSPSPVRTEDVVRLIDHTEGDVRVMVMLIAYAGLRPFEVARLCGRDVYPVERLIVVRDGKGRKDATVPMAAELVPVLAGASSGRLFPGVPSKGVSYRIRKALDECGIEARPYDLRHSFGTQVARRVNGNVVALARLMRHESVQTAQAYNGWVPPTGGLTDHLYGD